LTTMRKMTGLEYITWTDLFSSAIKAVMAVTGDEDAPGTAAAYAAEVRDAITALAEPDEFQLTVDLLPAAGAAVTAWQLESTLAARFGQFNSAVRAHLAQDLNAWLTSEAAGRVSHWWRRGGDTSMSPANVFPPETVLGTVAVTGSGTRTFTAGAVVPTTLYGGAQVAVRVINQAIGAAGINVTVTGLDATGTSRTWTGTISAESAEGTVVNLAGTGVTAGIAATACTITGGTNGDDFEIITVEDREIT
jgi:hypothetical protein